MWMICGKNTISLDLSVEDYTNQSSPHSLFLWDEFKTKYSSPPTPVVWLGFKVQDPADFLVTGFPGGSSTDLETTLLWLVAAFGDIT